MSLRGASRSLAKRATDIALAVLLLIVAAPVLLLATAAVAVRMGWPFWFRQERTGHEMRRFHLYKIRTMTDARDGNGRQEADGVRLTQLGRFLRRSSIDELPGLINVVRGQLSLVGPRPLLPRYEPWYTERERLRFTVRPGITGLAQVNGRNGVAWDDRLELDASYVDQWTYTLDLRIMARTLGKTLAGSGAVTDPTSAMQDLDAERSGAR